MTADGPTGETRAQHATPRVAVIGGGVAGLTAAHELSSRGFAVTVYEKQPHLGGKARSYRFRLADGGWLPAEHGFRFFPGFYRHVVDTMGRIDYDEHTTVADHLVAAGSALITDAEGRRLTVSLPTAERRPRRRPRLRSAWELRQASPGVWESACFLGALARLATSCQTRWTDQLEHQSWMAYVMPPDRRRRSETYRRLFAVGLTRTFVATRAEEMSARTGGRILLQLLYDTLIGPPSRQPADRVLDGPTSDVWIDPWTTQLRAKVDFRCESRVTRLILDKDSCTIAGFVLAGDKDPDPFDDVVLAVPCEALKELLAANPKLAGEAGLGKVALLQTRWMNGLVIGIRDDDPHQLRRPLPAGHVLCLDSQWALTLVDHCRLWSEVHRGPWASLLSVDISDWETPGTEGVGAMWVQPDRKQIPEEVWRQLRDHLGDDLPEQLPQSWALDAGVKWGGSDTLQMLAASQGATLPEQPMAEPIEWLIEWPTARPIPWPIRQPIRPPDRLTGLRVENRRVQVRTNDEPLLVNTAGSWDNRPEATTGIRNLFLAADYVRTNTDFASMEAANEAARRAVNALLEKHRRPEDPCRIFALAEPEVPWFRGPQRAACAADKILFRVGLRAPFRLPILAWTARFTWSWLTVRRAPPAPAPEDGSSPAASH